MRRQWVSGIRVPCMRKKVLYLRSPPPSRFPVTEVRLLDDWPNRLETTFKLCYPSSASLPASTHTFIAGGTRTFSWSVSGTVSLKGRFPRHSTHQRRWEGDGKKKLVDVLSQKFDLIKMTCFFWGERAGDVQRLINGNAPFPLYNREWHMLGQSHLPLKKVV